MTIWKLSLELNLLAFKSVKVFGWQPYSQSRGSVYMLQYGAYTNENVMKENVNFNSIEEKSNYINNVLYFLQFN